MISLATFIAWQKAAIVRRKEACFKYSFFLSTGCNVNATDRAAASQKPTMEGPEHFQQKCVFNV